MDKANKPKKHWYLKLWGMLIITILFVFFVFLFSFIFLVVNTINNDSRDTFYTENNIPEETLKKIKGNNNYSLGGENPKVTIVEFTDFACPMCKNSYTTMRNLKMKYKDDIELIFRDFPVVSESSIELSLAAYCAGEQGLFWIMHDKLFENQGISTKQEIFSLASEIGVEGNRFTTCFEKEKYSDKIYDNYSDGTSLEVTGTPTFFINGEMITGDIPLESWYKIIDYILSK